MRNSRHGTRWEVSAHVKGAAEKRTDARARE